MRPRCMSPVFAASLCHATAVETVRARPATAVNTVYSSAQVFENLKAILEANNGSFANVVKISTFLTDMSQLAAVRDVRVRYLPDPPPASTTVQVAALFRPEALIEVEVVAALSRRA